MPTSPVTIRIPRQCPHCGREGVVRLQHVIRGEQATLEWHCGGCGQEWAVTRSEEEGANMA